jgi:phosphotransacetylase/acyl dehydratase
MYQEVVMVTETASDSAATKGTFIENRTFDEIAIGDSAILTRSLSKSDIELFAVMSGDVNPAHLDEQYAAKTLFHHVIAHGMWSGALVSTVLGTELPGPGTIYLGQDLRFRRPVSIGDTVTVTVKAREKRLDKHIVVFDCRAVNQRSEEVVTGTAEVIAPTEKIRRARAELPDVELRHHDRYHQLIHRCKDLAPVLTAVAHPCDEPSLRAAVDAAEAQLIEPLLVGPEARIRAVAEVARLNIAPYRLVTVPHSHGAAAKAAAMASAGDVQALMKGSLHTDELMHAVLEEAGLRTVRRVSHVYLMDVPSYPRPLLITDAAINITPSLDDKRDICQNAVDFAKVLGIATPKVAILSAVETVSDRLRSTLDAAALCKMADRGQITGALLDGPLAFDNAVNLAAAQTKQIRSAVAGQADILVVPDLEAGNMLAKQLTFLAGADAAGIVLGARVPIILTSRADSLRTRLASCAVAVLLAEDRRRTPSVSAA